MGKYRTSTLLLRQTVFFMAMLSISSQLPGADTRRHPSLVDPTQTRCLVCHKALAGDLHDGASQEDCLSCHGFVKQEASTIVGLVGQLPPPTAPAATGGNGDVERLTGHREAYLQARTSSAAEIAGSPTEVSEQEEEAVAPPTASPFVAGATGVPSPEPQPADLYTRGLDAFEGEDFDAAFGIWREMLGERSRMFTIQIEMDDYLESARSTMRNHRGDGLYVVKKGGKFHVLGGFYGSRDAAAGAVGRLPEALRAGGAFPVPVARVLND